MAKIVDYTGALVQGRIQAMSMLARLGWKVAIDVVFDDSKNTAFTDGRKFIALPRQFGRHKLNAKHMTKAAKFVVAGLIAHEVCHFLQPLRKIAQAERETGLNDGISNVILDIHGENVIERFFPKYIKPLAYVRKTIWSESGTKWMTAQKLRSKFIQSGKIDQSDAFRSEAGTMSMLARFMTPSKPLSRRSAVQALTRKGKEMVLVHRNSGTPSFSTIPGDQKILDDFIRNFAAAYPELCNAPVNVPGSIPTYSSAQQALDEERQNGSTSDGEESDVDKLEDEQLDTDPVDDVPAEVQDLVAEAMKVKLLPRKHAKRRAPLSSALKLAPKLRVQLKQSQTFTQIVAPVTIDRRELGKGTIQPWHMDLSQGKAIGRQVTIAIDLSNSMSGILHKVYTAAQAIALAVTADGGRVASIQFGTEAFVSQDDDDLPLFSKPRKLGGTSFTFLEYAWVSKKQNTIIVITDGDSQLMPRQVSDTDKARTHMILLGSGCSPTKAATMGQVHQCSDLEQLPKILVKISNMIS
jgi:hypothetical protein